MFEEKIPERKDMMNRHVALVKFNSVGYVKAPIEWAWKEQDEYTKDLKPTPGFVIEFPWFEKTECNSNKNLAIYHWFSDLIGGVNHRLKMTTEPMTPAMFFPYDPETDKGLESKIFYNVFNLIINLETFANNIAKKVDLLKKFLEKKDDVKYRNELFNFKSDAKMFYNEKILPFSIVKIPFIEVNLFDFIAPFEKYSCSWVPENTDESINVEKLIEERDKNFKSFSEDESLKKIYFDLYDICFSDIVENEFEKSGCGYGWYQLIRKAFEKFREVEEKSYFWWKRVYVAQSKEKFGLLRIYIYTPSEWYFENIINGKGNKEFDEVEEYIQELENESEGICESCGKTHEEDESVFPSADGGYWIKTLCSACREKKNNF